MSIKNIRLEVMQFLEKNVDSFVDQYLIPVEKIWQPTDFLPDSQSDTFFDEVKELREIAKELPYDFWVTLVGDTITEEALPTYESWLMDVEGIDNVERNGWSKWIRQWTGEENRHGDLLNKYLYLSGRVNMREVEMTTQHLINDGFDIGTGRDTCEMMLAFQYMMKAKIVMPAHFLRESGEKISSAFEQFSDSAQRIGVYTAADYVDIMQKLIDKWEIDKMSGLTDEAEKARDYLMKLPARMARVSERLVIPQESHIFKWVEPVVIR